MTPTATTDSTRPGNALPLLFGVFIVVGFATFFVQMNGGHAQQAWQAYLINFLLWSAVAQGGLLFSTVMHVTRARWSGPLANLAEAFTAFFPVSLALFGGLLLGREYVFPWLHHDLHGKEIWLNLPFLFSRVGLGLILLYALGGLYLLQAHKLKSSADDGAVAVRKRMTVFAILYIIAFAFILSLVGFDLVMAADPHWYSTLFGAYSFIKAVYVGLGGLIILAAILQLKHGAACTLTDKHFHDVGKLFFAFCLVWADFFYCQLVVIWYGNIPEETHYVMLRTITAPWNQLAWTVFTVCFIAPFIILINKKVKTMPGFMLALCSVALVGIWLEHLLLLGPALGHDAKTLHLGLADALITLGFFGLMALAITLYLKKFPELLPIAVEKEAA